MNEINDMQMASPATPAAESGKVTRRPARLGKDAEYLTEAQVKQLIKAADRTSRHGQRDRTLVLLMFRHGLRSVETVNLRWSAVHFDSKRLDVARAKNGNDSIHELTGRELRELRQLKREWAESDWVFQTERGAQMSTSNVRKLLAKLGEVAKFAFPVHPHMLRHAAGHYLAERGTDTRTIQDFLGHKNITHTVRYTRGTSARFVGLFKD
jgi:site-specific recombinase XerD